MTVLSASGETLELPRVHVAHPFVETVVVPGSGPK
jgi:hypothetical protein